MKKYKWNTYKVIQETKDAVTIFFDTGQAAFTFQAGQFLNITCNIDGEQVSRSYSFSSAVSGSYPSITVKRMANGKMSNYLVSNAKDIREWDIEAPFGNFGLNKKISSGFEMIFLAGGSGMSPLLSMLTSLGESVHKPLLLYANRTPEDIIYRDQLAQMQTSNALNAFYAFSADIQDIKDWNCISGRFTQPIIQSIISQQIQEKDTAHYFICGPAALMQLYKNALSAMQIPESQVHTEYFDPIPVSDIILETGDEWKEVLVNYFESCYVNDELQTYECTSLVEVQTGQSLLDALIENEIRVPNSCKKGTCGSCWARKENGKVQMINNYALTEEEVAEGKILLCQSFPLDQSVSIAIGQPVIAG